MKTKTLFVAVLILLSACQQDTTNSQTVHFVTEATYPPLVFQNELGEIQGLETEILQAICKQANLTCKISHQSWDSAITGVKMGLVDGIYGGMDKTPTRAKEVLFTETILTNDIGWLIAPHHHFDADTQRPTGTIGVQSGSLYHQYLLHSDLENVSFKVYQSIQDAFLDLQSNRIQMILADFWVLQHWHKKHSAYHLVRNTQSNLQQSAGYAIAFNKEKSQWVETFNQALAIIKKNGQYEAIINQWNTP